MTVFIDNTDDKLCIKGIEKFFSRFNLKTKVVKIDYSEYRLYLKFTPFQHIIAIPFIIDRNAIIFSTEDFLTVSLFLTTKLGHN